MSCLNTFSSVLAIIVDDPYQPTDINSMSKVSITELLYLPSLVRFSQASDFSFMCRYFFVRFLHDEQQQSVSSPTASMNSSAAVRRVKPRKRPVFPPMSEIRLHGV